MAAKKVKFSLEARDKMLHGIDILANAVRVTLGPKSRNVVLDKSFGAPRITKDGVVAYEVARALDAPGKAASARSTNSYPSTTSSGGVNSL